MTDLQANAEAGRREAHKQAIRAAVLDAASGLFARQGYEATTVRQIADAAGVTERTVYRYFDGKEGLLAQDALAWMDALCAAIKARPEREPPLVALHRAMVESARAAESANGTPAMWRLADGPRPLQLLRRAAPRPLRRLEQSIADALLARPRAGRVVAPSSAPPGASGTRGGDAVYAAQVLARVGVAVLRSAISRHRQLLAQPDAQSPGLAPLLDDGFAVVAALSAGAQETG